MKIYILEEQEYLSRMISYSLGMERERVSSFHKYEDMAARAKADRPDLILLYEEEGTAWITDTVERLKVSDLRDIPVIALSDRASEEEASRAMDKGAELFLRTPVGSIELYAYIHAVMRRINGEKGAEEGAVQAGSVRILPKLHQVFVGDRAIELLPSEFQILRILAKNEGRVLTDRQIARETRRYGKGIRPGTVKAKIHTLRNKLPGGTDLIRTVRGVGYKFEAEE